jgi:hypothetical protein
MRPVLLSLLLSASAISTYAQTARMRLGFTAGTTVGWAAKDNQLSTNFFAVSRAGFQGGVINTLDVGEHFFSSIGANYSIQSFAMRQTGIAAVGVDARFRTHNFELPLTLGYKGYLGSLLHREYIGAGLQFNLSTAQNVKLSGDSSSYMTYTTSADVKTSAYPVLIAGFEVGSVFGNDAALFFGASFRYGMQTVYNGTLNTNRFVSQTASYNGSYLGIGITYYLPRYSYWFKREFIY